MISVSQPWVSPEEDRPFLESVPLLIPIVTQLSDAHDELVTIRITRTDSEEILQNLKEHSGALDLIHDGKFRGLYWVLTGLSEFQTDRDAKQLTLDIRDTLFPDGLSNVKMSYLDESGAAAMIQAAITPEIRDFLARLTIGEFNLADELDLFCEAGETLGKVEREKVRLQETKDDSGITRADVLAARNRWIKLVQVMIELMDLAPEIDEEKRQHLLQPLINVEAKLQKQSLSEPTDDIDPLLNGDDQTDNGSDDDDATGS